jgi:exoribonuclease-2
VTTAQPALPVPSLPDEPRRDLTYLPAFAIDNAWTETPDDALSLEANRLWVHVADPAAIAPPNSPLDLEARGRGASLYLPEDTIHMLPAAATPLLGLGLAPVSPALSFGIDLAAGCEIAAVEIVPSWVRVTRLTYEEVAGRLTEEPFAQLYRLALAYQARRVANGAFTLNLPEVNVRVTRSGADPPPLPPSLAELALSLSKGKGEKYTPLLEGEGPGERSAWRVLLRPVPPLPSQTLVENAMILAGEAVARFALEHGIPLPFATQEPADSDERGDSFAKLPAGGSLAAAFAFRRRLKRSQYRGAAAPHSGLGLAAYTQVTSPLRRYLDLVAHQQLRAYLTGAPLLDTGQIVERAGATEAVIGGIRQAEQFSNQHWTLVYLLQNPKWRGEGVVVERRERNSVVLIPELGLEPSIYLPADPPLDSTVRLTVTHVDLPRLDVRFRVSG